MARVPRIKDSSKYAHSKVISQYHAYNNFEKKKYSESILKQFNHKPYGLGAEKENDKYGES